jgi:hypothetical protein
MPSSPDPQRLPAPGYSTVPHIVHPAVAATPWQAHGFVAPDLYAEIRSVRDALSTLSSKLDSVQAAAERIQDHESRLRALESRRWPIPAAMLLVAVVAAILTLLPLLLK